MLALQEELRGDLGVGGPSGCEVGDLELLGGCLFRLMFDGTLPGSLARGRKLQSSPGLEGPQAPIRSKSS